MTGKKQPPEQSLERTRCSQIRQKRCGGRPPGASSGALSHNPGATIAILMHLRVCFQMWDLFCFVWWPQHFQAVLTPWDEQKCKDSSLSPNRQHGDGQADCSALLVPRGPPAAESGQGHRLCMPCRLTGQQKEQACSSFRISSGLAQDSCNFSKMYFVYWESAKMSGLWRSLVGDKQILSARCKHNSK